MPKQLICIAGNFHKACAIQTAKKAIKILEKKKIPFVVDSGFLKIRNAMPLNKINADFFLVFGGDGTMLHVVRELKRQKPVLGVNCGNRGHLMQVQPEQIEAAIEKILRGKFSIEKRARLNVIVDGKSAPSPLNEIIVTPKKSFTLFDYSLSVGQRVLSGCADAVAIVTPNGSTAFALAASGKKIEIKKKVFEILPVHAFSGIKKPLVVSDKTKILIEPLGKKVGCEAIIDGQRRLTIKKEVVVQKGRESALFVKLR